MAFLAPLFLTGLVAVGLPLYLHLLQQHKTTPRPFSSLMFFERRVQSSVKHRRLKYRVLFALRALLFALLVLAFARPAIESSGIASAHSGRVIALLVDDSFSMSQGTRLNDAKAEASRAIDSMRTADRAQLIVFGGPTRALTSLTGDRSALHAALNTIEPGDGLGSYSEVLRAVRSLVQSSKSSVEAHLFTDLQKSSAPANFADLRLPESAQLTIHTVGSAIPNFAVESVLAPRRVAAPKSAHIQATIVSYSDQPVSKRVSLAINNRVVESRAVSIAPGGRALAEFTNVDVPFGLNRGTVSIDGSDNFPQDDHFYFAIERSDPAPALFIHGSGDTRSGLFFQNALGASSEPEFVLTQQTYAQAASTSFDHFAFVVLSDPETPLSFQPALDRYVMHGGSVLRLLGHNAGGSARASGFASVSQVDSTSPVLRSSTRWDGVRFFRTAPLNPGTDSVLLRLDDGVPLLLSRRQGEGRILTFTSALDNIDNDLPVHPIFVPFVQQLSESLGRSNSATSIYSAGAFYDLRPAETPNDTSPIEITGPKNERVLSLSESTKVGSLPLEHQGFYEIRRQNGRHELAAVNPDRRESDFSVLPSETVALWKNTGVPSRSGERGASSESTQQRTELWWWILLGALALAVAESVLGNRHLETKEGIS